MQLWFTETHESDQRTSWKTGQVLYHRRSEYQDIIVLDTPYFGKMLVIDDCVMTTERDEFVYHEMISHPGLIAAANPRSVCVVGGGDGGTVREVLKHDCIERVVLAEIDADVIDVSRRFFPGHTTGLNDPRVEIMIGDGFDYLEKHPNEFDAILSDSTDPVGPGVVLFEDRYFKLAKAALREGGFFVTQAEGIWSRSSNLSDIRKRMTGHFDRVDWYGIPIPTYPNGNWSFLIASEQLNPRAVADPGRQRRVAETTNYYSPEIHQAVFAVPPFVAARFRD